MKKLTLSDFISKSKKIHGDLFDYTLVKYINSTTKVDILCGIHGIFSQKPNNHLNGFGCNKCNGKHNMGLDMFISKANGVHNNKYDYSNSVYINNSTKIIIICDIHNEFNQLPSAHLKGQGCPKCFGTEHMRITQNEFIEKSNLIHNNKYDYTNSIFLSKHKKVEIICSNHGSFYQTPYRHLKGSMCHKCFVTKNLTLIEFIEKSNLKHNNKYDYSLSIYLNNSTKLDIICKQHGIFSQNPGMHMSGNGCPKCNHSKGELFIQNYLNINNFQYISQYKFSDLKYKQFLRFDFAIFNNNQLKLLIEYNGEQHYNYRGQFNMTNKQYDESLLRDELKKEYCNKNNIRLLIIRYDENIEEKLNIIHAE